MLCLIIILLLCFYCELGKYYYYYYVRNLLTCRRETTRRPAVHWLRNFAPTIICNVRDYNVPYSPGFIIIIMYTFFFLSHVYCVHIVAVCTNKLVATITKSAWRYSGGHPRGAKSSHAHAASSSPSDRWSIGPAKKNTRWDETTRLFRVAHNAKYCKIHRNAPREKSSNYFYCRYDNITFATAQVTDAFIIVRI